MANSGLTSGLTDLLGIDTNAGNAELQQALAALQAVGVPTAEQLNLPELKKYVSAGVLSPSQYQAIMANPQAYSDAITSNQDNSGSAAQKAALQQLGGIVQSGGSSPINAANLKNNLNQTNQAMQAARAGIGEEAQQRGVSGGGLEYINKLMNEQSGAENANMGATNAAADNAKLALQALTQQGQLGGQLQGQANQSAQAQAEAARQIAEYNSQLQSQANQYNTQNANDAQAANLANAQGLSNQNVAGENERAKYNAGNAQTVFQDQMAKAGGMAGAYGNQAANAQKQAEMGAALTGGLIGSGAQVYGGSLAGKKPKGYAQGGEVNGMCNGGKCYAMGGEIHDHELCMKAGGDVPGDQSDMPMGEDDSSNDTVPANLSPGEIVLPRSVSQAPDAPQKAQQFVQQTQGMSSGGVGSFAEVLQKLEENGIELRLGIKGS